MELPLLLAGPIIRRVEYNQVNIWLATSKEVAIDATIYKTRKRKNEETYKYDLLYTKSQVSCAPFGENLYINLVRIEPDNGAFPTDILLGYNLTFDSNYDLGSFQLLDTSNPEAIVYGNHQYPTFFIPEKSEQQWLYGSCRKSHGEGEDLFIGTDHLLQKENGNLSKRPSHLFLMGDQIYADDIADPLFAVLHPTAEYLMGNRKEDLPTIEERLNQEPFKSALHQVHGRQYIAERFCKFTSNHADNHLFTFGEYATMYLLNWSPELWNQMGIPSFEEIKEQDRFYYMFHDGSEEKIKELEDHELRYEEQLKALKEFVNGIASARRIMANIPTYMIFDDHDITDDWNISENWRRLVQESPLGSHVIANGLTAYWAFQGWGNNPNAFHHQFIDIVSHYFFVLADEIPLKNEVVYEEWKNLMWSFDSWFFLTPTKPTSVFLDTRTMRHFDSSPQPLKIGRRIEEKNNSPELISDAGWERVSQVLQKSNWDNQDPLVIVSPVPLYGIDLIESVLLQYIEPLRNFGLPVKYQFDMEAWKFNGKGYHAFIKNLLDWNGDHYFIISGDTHLASNVRAKIRYRNEENFSIHQFTSSPIKNMSFSGLFGLMLKAAIWFNAMKKKRKIIYRSCNEDFHLVESKEEILDTKGILWRENLQYMATEKGDVVETNNNIGLITVTNDVIKNTLLTFDGKKLTECEFSTNKLGT